MVNFVVIVDDNTHIEEQIPQIQKNFINLAGQGLENKLKQGPPAGFTPVDEGHLSGAWTTRKTENQIVSTNSAEYAVYQNEGTGVFGPSHRAITPKKAKALHWEKGGTHYFAKSVKGVKGKHFVEKATKAVESEIPNYLQQAVNKVQ